jgi:uncharacterized damage-inducible protein DinB
MFYETLKDSIDRHLEETLPLIRQLIEVDIMSKPISEGREIGEIVLHLVRSVEYYMSGIVTNKWEPLPYTLETHDSAESIINLAEDVFKKAKLHSNIIVEGDLSRVIESFNRPATVAEILFEMIEHGVHHRGQITVYYRLLGVTPNKIDYIV